MEENWEMGGPQLFTHQHTPSHWAECIFSLQTGQIAA